MNQFSISHRTSWALQTTLPPDFEAIKHWLASKPYDARALNPAQTPHAPHQRASELCDEEACLGHDWSRVVRSNVDYGRRIFGDWSVR